MGIFSGLLLCNPLWIRRIWSDTMAANTLYDLVGHHLCGDRNDLHCLPLEYHRLANHGSFHCKHLYLSATPCCHHVCIILQTRSFKFSKNRFSFTYICRGLSCQFRKKINSCLTKKQAKSPKGIYFILKTHTNCHD